MTEEEILQEISSKQKSLEELSILKKNLKAEYEDTETLYLENKIQLERLREELRVLQSRKINSEPSDRSIDINRFKLLLPAIMDKLTNNSES